MKIELKNPITVGEDTYNHAHLSLSISSGFSDIDSYTLALRLVPYRLAENGEIIKLETHQLAISSLNGLTDQLASGLTIEIIEAVQKFVKGGE